MSYYAEPFSSEARYGACTYKMEDLDLTAGGLPGLVFWGTLDIEPDDDGADWFLERATAFNEQSGIYTIYDGATNAAIFEAIRKAVYADKSLCAYLGAHAKEHA